MWVKTEENYMVNVADASYIQVKDRFRGESDGAGGFLETTDYISSEVIAIFPGSSLATLLFSFSADEAGDAEKAGHRFSV